MNHTDFFPPDYFAARERFRAAVARLGWPCHALTLDARGPAGEVLTLDAAVSPTDGPGLLLSTGVHGVEGYFGSAVLLAVLDEWQRTGPPAGMRVVLLHAVNPFGFAHNRRFDENNVDPNRNYLLDGEKFAGAPPLYGKMDPFLNPPRPPSRWEPFTLKSAYYIARYGLPALKQAIAGGQYEFPRGLFFGGHGPSQSQLLLREHLPGWLAGSPRAIHLDFHTGLGAWGSYKLLMDPPIDPKQFARAGQYFGVDVVQPSSADGVAYRTLGAFLPWCTERTGIADTIALCVEFGTYGNVETLAAMRAENQAFHWGDRNDPLAKARLRETFCPESPQWRQRVLDAALRVVQHGVAGLYQSNPTPQPPPRSGEGEASV